MQRGTKRWIGVRERKKEKDRERDKAKDYGLVFRARGCLMNIKTREKRPTKQRRESPSPKTQLLTRRDCGVGMKTPRWRADWTEGEV